MLLSDLLNNNWCTSMRCDSATGDLNQTHEFSVHTNRDNDTATLITGYNGTDQYDSYFILSKDNLIELRDMLSKAIDKFDYFKEQLELDEQIRLVIADSLKRIVNNSEDSDLNVFIKYKQMLECSPYESLYGSVFVDISWSSNLIKKEEPLVVLLTRDEFVMIEEDLSFFSEVKDNMKIVILNCDTKNSINEAYQAKMAEINHTENDYGLPTEISKEDIDVLKNNILANIDEIYKK